MRAHCIMTLLLHDHGSMGQTSRTVIVFDGRDTHEAITFDDLRVAAGWMEAIDIDDGEYEEIAWFDDGEVIDVGVEQVTRGDLRVKLTATGRYDFPALCRALARTRPDLADANMTTVQAFAAEELAADAAWRRSRWHQRFKRWLRQQRSR